MIGTPTTKVMRTTGTTKTRTRMSDILCYPKTRKCFFKIMRAASHGVLLRNGKWCSKSLAPSICFLSSMDPKDWRGLLHVSDMPIP